MTARLDYAAQSPELFKKLGVYSHAAHTLSFCLSFLLFFSFTLFFKF